MLAQHVYRGADLTPALRRQRYVTPPDSPGQVKALSLPERGSLSSSHPINQPAGRIMSAIHSEP